MEDLFKGHGVKIALKAISTEPNQDPKEAFRDSFLKVRETLTRIGIASKKDQTLYQSCHILHKRGEYAILHFKELFALDGKPCSLTDEDLQRRNRIVSLLGEWGLLEVKDSSQIEKQVPLNHIKILHFDEKKQWTLVAKYDVGTKRKQV